MGVGGAGKKISVKQSCMQNWGSRLLDTSSHIQFFSGNRCKLMAQWLRQFPVSQATWVWFYCFASGELECWPGPALAHMCRPGTYTEIIAIVEPWSWLTTRSVASFFLISQKHRKNKHLVRDILKAHAPACPGLSRCTEGQKLFILVSMSSLIENCGSCPENPEQCPTKQKWIKKSEQSNY